MSEPIDVSKFALIYAGAQKNVAPAGLTIVIVREDMLGNVNPITPTMCDYTINAEAKSMHNTPPCWCIYICKLVMDWLLENGGLEARKAINEKKAALLYDCLEPFRFLYHHDRAGQPFQDERPLQYAQCGSLTRSSLRKAVAGLACPTLKAHRSTGGLRASIYNCMPMEGVEYLVEFMKKFEAEKTSDQEKRK